MGVENAQAVTVETMDDALKGKTSAQISEMIDSGELNDVINDPGARKKLVDMTHALANNSTNNAPDVDPEADPAAPKATDPDPNDPGDPSKGDQYGGYGSPEALLKATQEAQNMAASQKEHLDSLNSRMGTIGSEKKALEEENARLKTQLDTKPPTGVEIVPDTRTSPVNPNDLIPPPPPPDGDYLGVDYLASKAKYDKAVADQLTHLSNENAKLNKANQDLSGKINPIESDIKTTKETQDKKAASESLIGLYSDLDAFQKSQAKAGNPYWKTSIPISDLDAKIVSLGKEDAQKLLPPHDLEVHTKLSAVLQSYGTFDEKGVFQKNTAFNSFDEVMLLQSNRDGSLDQKTKDAVTKARVDASREVVEKINQRGDTADTLPPGSSGSSEAEMQLTQQQKTEQLKTLLAIPSHELRRSAPKLEQYYKLSKELGVNVPQVKAL